MEVRQTIDDLYSSLEHITAEDQLLRVIADGPAALRECYPSHRSSFNLSNIEF